MDQKQDEKKVSQPEHSKKKEREEIHITLISTFLLGIGVPRRNGSHCGQQTAGRDKDSKFPTTSGRYHQATEWRSRAPPKQDGWGGGPQGALRSLESLKHDRRGQMSRSPKEDFCNLQNPQKIKNHIPVLKG